MAKSGKIRNIQEREFYTKKEGAREGVCPVCGKNHTIYGMFYPDDFGGYYEWECNYCGSHGKEFYKFIFVGSTVGKIGCDTEESPHAKKE